MKEQHIAQGEKDEVRGGENAELLSNQTTITKQRNKRHSLKNKNC